MQRPDLGQEKAQCLVFYTYDIMFYTYDIMFYTYNIMFYTFDIMFYTYDTMFYTYDIMFDCSKAQSQLQLIQNSCWS